MGSVDYGRNYGVLYDIGSWTDVLLNLVLIRMKLPIILPAGRANGVLTYRNNDDFFGLVDGLNICVAVSG